MKKELRKNILLLGLLFSCLNLNSQSSVDWIKSYDSSSEEYIVDTEIKVINSTKFIYQTGIFNGTIDIDVSVNSYNLSSATGFNASFLSKNDENNNLIWGFGLGNSSVEVFTTSIEVIPDGSVIMVGYFNGVGNLDLDPSVNVFNISNSGLKDGFVAKYDSNGNFQFGFKLGSAYDQKVTDVAHDFTQNSNEDAFYIAGETGIGSVDYNPLGTSVLHNTFPMAVKAAFLCKYSLSSGQLTWYKTFFGDLNNGPLEAGGCKLVVSNTEVLIAGSFKNANLYIDFGSNQLLTNATTNNYTFCGKFDKNGIYLKKAQFNGTLTDIDMSENGNTAFATSGGQINKINFSTITTVNNYSFSGQNITGSARNLFLDNTSGKLYVLGFAVPNFGQGNLDVDLTANADYINFQGADVKQGFVSVYNSSNMTFLDGGKIITPIDTYNSLTFNDIIFENNNLYISGYCNSSFQYYDMLVQPLYSVGILNNQGIEDSFVIKYNMCTQSVPPITITENNNSICNGASVTFTSTQQNYQSYQWKINGNNVGSGQINFTTSNLNNNDIVSCEIVSGLRAGCLLTPTSTSNNIVMNVINYETPSVNISSLNTINCPNSLVTFLANPQFGGSNASYTWFINSQSQSGNTNQLSLNSLNEGDTVNCILTSDYACLNINNISSPNLIFSYTSVPVLDSIYGGSHYCVGDTIQDVMVKISGVAPFNINYTYNNGTIQNLSNSTGLFNLGNQSGVYQLIDIQDANCMTNINQNYSVIVHNLPVLSLLDGGDTYCQGDTINQIFAEVFGSAPYQINYTFNGNNLSVSTSNGIANLGNQAGTYEITQITDNYCTISLSAIEVININDLPTILSQDNSICGPGVVDLEAGSDIGIMFWYSDSLTTNLVGTGNVYQTPFLNNTTRYFVQSESVNQCKSIVLGVNAVIYPIPNFVTQSVFGAICENSSVDAYSIFDIGITEWYDSPTGGNLIHSGDTIHLLNLSNSTTIYYEGFSGVCRSLRDSIFINVLANQTPSIQLNSITSGICQNDSIIFSGIAQYAGDSPIYSWFVNDNLIVNTSTPNFSLINGNDSLKVYCQINSNYMCVDTNINFSDTIYHFLYPIGNPLIVVNQLNTVDCIGTTTNLSTNAQFTGNSPIYAWYLNNNIIIGETSPNVNLIGLNEYDEIYCVMTSNYVCNSFNIDTSNLYIHQFDTLTFSASIYSSDTTICAGDSVFINTLLTNGGTNPQFEWSLNGNILAETTNFLNINNLNDGDQITCVVISNENCVSNNTAIVVPIIFDVNSIPNSSFNLVENDLIAIEQNLNYQWFDCNTMNLLLGENDSILNIPSNGEYGLIVENQHGCIDTSNCMIISNLGKDELQFSEIYIFPNPTSDFIHINSKLNIQKINIYDIGGKLVKEINFNFELIDFSFLENGNYRLELIFENQIINRMIFKN